MTTAENLVMIGASLFAVSVVVLCIMLARSLRRTVEEQPPARTPYTDDAPTRQLTPPYWPRHSRGGEDMRDIDWN